MNPTSYGPMFAATLFVGMLVSLEVGHRIGRLHLSRHAEGEHPGTGAVNGAGFGLLVAFTFSVAASRSEKRCRSME